jgi:GT2 family glycosyltransferase
MNPRSSPPAGADTSAASTAAERTAAAPARLDVTVVAYHGADLVERCLASTRHLAGLGTLVVVDHGDGRCAELARAAGAIGLTDPTNPGFGAGQNRAVAATSSPYVLLLNPDAELDPAGVAAGLLHLDAHPDVAMVQGVVTSDRTGRPERSAGRSLGPLHLLGRALALRGLARHVPARLVGALGLADQVDRVPAHPTEVETLAATAVLVRASAFAAVGGFDTSYFLYGEDLDLCRRLRAAGWRLVNLPLPWARHRDGATSGGRVRRELHWWHGTLQFAAREWSAPAWAAARVAGAIEAIRLLAAGPRQAGQILGLFLAPRARIAAGRRPATGDR